MQKSVLGSLKFRSPLASGSVLRPKQSRAAKHLAISLSLTSLVDAFAILLIYLLTTGTGGAENIDLRPGIVLPTASQTEQGEKQTIVRVEKGQYFINNKKVSQSQLTAHLNKIREGLEKDKKLPHLMIQADREADYQQLDPIIKAGSEVGFYVLRFAVLHEEGI